MRASHVRKLMFSWELVKSMDFKSLEYSSTPLHISHDQPGAFCFTRWMTILGYLYFAAMDVFYSPPTQKDHPLSYLKVQVLRLQGSYGCLTEDQ